METHCPAVRVVPRQPDPLSPEAALLHALAAYVTADRTPFERAAFSARLTGAADLLAFEQLMDAPEGETNSSEITTKQQFEANFLSQHQELWNRYGMESRHVEVYRCWYVSVFGPFKGADLELATNGEPRWCKNMYNCIRDCSVFRKDPNIKGHFLVTSPGR